MTRERYEGLEEYLHKHHFRARQIDKFFTNPDNWPHIAALARRLTGSSSDSAGVRKGAAVLIVDALEAPIASKLLSWTYRREHVKTLGDITLHPRSRIANIPGIGKIELEKIDTALVARRLAYAPPKGR